MYTGNEVKHNRDIIYLGRIAGRLVGTVHLTIGKSCPAIGGLGEVVTVPEFRRRGIASRLCALARDDFRAWGGQALFLGSGDPGAARVYHRCGYRKLPGTNVMAYIASGDSPEAFLVEYFQPRRHVVVAGTPADRIPMIPLIVWPHAWQVMDANVGIVSTRYAIQHSCMGLYPLYERLLLEGNGTWFAARTDQGRAVGLSTARLSDAELCQVDGFVHRNFTEAWEPLLQAAIRWGEESGAATFHAHVSSEDEFKYALFETLGFRKAHDGVGLPLGDRLMPSAVLEKSL